MRSSTRIITVANQKGGVGKSTTCLALCAGFAEKGYKVLGIDLDPQGSFTTSSGVQNNEDVSTAYSLLKGDCTLEEAVQHSDMGFDVVASGDVLMYVEGQIPMSMGRNYRLTDQLEKSDLEYDYIIIDVPPSLGFFTLNALTASTDVLIPTVADPYSLDGIIKLSQTIDDVREYNVRHPGMPRILGVVLTMYDQRPTINQISTEMAENICDAIKTKLFDTKIRVNVAIKSAHTYKKSVFQYNRGCNAALDYAALVDELTATHS